MPPAHSTLNDFPLLAPNQARDIQRAYNILSSAYAELTQFLRRRDLHLRQIEQWQSKFPDVYILLLKAMESDERIHTPWVLAIARKLLPLSGEVESRFNEAQAR